MIMNQNSFFGYMSNQLRRCIWRITFDIVVPYLVLLFEKESLVGNIVTVS